MNDLTPQFAKLAAKQEAIRAKCFHPSGAFSEFKRGDIEQSIPDRFGQMVAKFAGRVAVKDRNRKLTYAELNQSANCVAQAILAQRGEVHEPVAVLLPKGAPLVVAILGALKAGKIFVLLDPTLPHSRIRYILDDVQAGLLVTNGEYLLMAKALAGQNSWLNMDEVDTAHHAENPGIALKPDAFAYILYTSGSTGRPKGIVENHRNLLHYIMTETNDLHICAEDRLTFLASQGRDIFRAVLNGAAVYPIEVKQEGLSGLAHWLIQEEVTIYNSVASAFRHFVNNLTGIEEFPHLRLIKLMGETVYRQDVELYQKHFSAHCIFVNWYGPNETGLLSHYLIDKTMRLTNSVVPVGYAVKDKVVQVWDEHDKEAPVGEPGEIVVRSRYLSPGYWCRSDLVDRAFRRVSSEGAEHRYRTGDIGSMGPDGCLIHLGRKDSQVKIRGNRVEVAEIETALLDLDTVREAVVVAREDAPGEKRLVAYIVPNGTRPPTTRALRSALTAKLPGYMIPSAFVFLDVLPSLGIGKVDRRALPDLGKMRPDLDSAYVAPRTPVESDLARIWAETLFLDQVGIHDNFFDLGGHSLAATRVVAHIISKFQLELPIQLLFQSPTIAEMAAVLASHQGKKLGAEELGRIVGELESLSEGEAKRLLADKSCRSPARN